jgi:VanZ family protein
MCEIFCRKQCIYFTLHTSHLTPKKMFWKYNLPTIIWATFVLFLTLLPGKEMPDIQFSLSELLKFDKVAHFFVFAVLVCLMAIGFTKQNTYSNIHFKPVRHALLGSILYGVIIEIIQAYIPDRNFEINDLIANTFGSGLGVGLFYLIYRT